MMGAAPPSSSLPDDWTKPLSQPRLFGPRRTRACGQHRTSRAPDCVDKPAAAPDQYGSAAYRRSAARRPARAAIPGRPSRTERRGPRPRCDDGPDRRRPCPRRLWRTISRFWTEAAARTKMRTQQFYSPVDEQRRPIPRVHPVERGLAASGRTGPVQHSARRCRLALRELEDGHGSSRMGGYRPNDLSDSDGSLPSGTLIGPDGPGGLLRRPFTFSALHSGRVLRTVPFSQRVAQEWAFGYASWASCGRFPARRTRRRLATFNSYGAPSTSSTSTSAMSPSYRTWL